MDKVMEDKNWRLNVEGKFMQDPRFHVLSKLLGNVEMAIGTCVCAWFLAQRFWVKKERGLIPPSLFTASGFDPMIVADLAEVRAGGVYVWGTEEQCLWIVQRKAAAARSVERRRERGDFSRTREGGRFLPRADQTGDHTATERPPNGAPYGDRTATERTMVDKDALTISVPPNDDQTGTKRPYGGRMVATKREPNGDRTATKPLLYPPAYAEGETGPASPSPEAGPPSASDLKKASNPPGGRRALARDVKTIAARPSDEPPPSLAFDCEEAATFLTLEAETVSGGRKVDENGRSGSRVGEGRGTTPERVSGPKITPFQALCRETWESYAAAYADRWKVPPVRAGKENAQIKQLVQRLGGDAPAVVAFYVSNNNAYYVRAVHDLGLALRDAAPLRTQWATGRTVTNQAAQRAETMTANAQAAANVLARFKGGDNK